MLKKKMSSKVCNIKLYTALNVLWQVMVVNWSSRWESPTTAMIRENPVHRSSLSQRNSEKEPLRIIHLPSYNRCFWILLIARNKFWFRHSSTCKVYVWQSWNRWGIAHCLKVLEDIMNCGTEGFLKFLPVLGKSTIVFVSLNYFDG